MNSDAPNASAEFLVTTRGRFRIRAGDRDVTPPGPKACALVGAVALAPDGSRARRWLQRLIWSDRAPGQASDSLRRLLADLRRTHPGLLEADRSDVRLGPGVARDGEGPGPPLEGVELHDAAFTRWIEGLRAAPQALLPSGGAALFRTETPEGAPLRIRLEAGDALPGGAELFVLGALHDALRQRIATYGAAEVAIRTDRVSAPTADIRILVALDTPGPGGSIRLRAVAGADGRFLWSGRIGLDAPLETVIAGERFAAFVSAAASGTLSAHGRSSAVALTPYMRMQRAAAMLFQGDLPALARAETELAGLCTGDATAIALSWRAFARLTRILEFADAGPDLRAEALALGRDALARGPANPLVLALAATLEAKLAGDMDRCRFLALAAIRSNDQNPYALDALAEAEAVRGAPGAAHETARRVRVLATGMPNAFYWDVQVCLTALRVGETARAARAARTALVSHPGYRPALRYATALSLLEGAPEAAARYAARLALREPGFTIDHLRAPGYPVHTLHATGLAERLGR
ncbi:hypothetical protein LX81_02920 [Palleronia aestuarii]|uniref:Uncharacterized protein n=1 Tax=Palleronia aestuarii TaxID=568105 RepID=A0A2W7N813_9RHOB|nr:hypothetical protein [Palleronia aestuarii]PZX14337.1 hypothetical protein LX81_02920 [Palleronia aestuarii]